MVDAALSVTVEPSPSGIRAPAVARPGCRKYISLPSKNDPSLLCKNGSVLEGDGSSQSKSMGMIWQRNEDMGENNLEKARVMPSST